MICRLYYAQTKQTMNPFRKFGLGMLKKLKFLPPEVYMPYYYEYYTEKKLDLKNPKEFNEKIQWLKVYYHPPILSKLVDKYAVREYVEKKIGAVHLNQLYGVYEDEKDINFDDLPNQFVLKAAHGYNFNLIVKDKQQLNVFKARLKFKKWMSRNQYYRGGLEWAYKNTPHRIIAEKYLPEIEKNQASDFKFYCFNGKPKYVEITLQVNGVDLRCNYDLEWKKAPFYRKDVPFFEGEAEKPKTFETMIELATRLADNFPFVRVDLYDINSKIIFGEMTFYPADGRFPYLPDEYNTIIGNYINLPDLPEGQKEITTI